MSIANLTIAGASMTLFVLFCAALWGNARAQRSAKNSDLVDIADGDVAHIAPHEARSSGGDQVCHDSGHMSLEDQLRENLRRVRAGESLAALSQEACERERAHMQVAEDSGRAMAWVGRVSSVIRDELGNPVAAGDVSVHVCCDSVTREPQWDLEAMGAALEERGLDARRAGIVDACCVGWDEALRLVRSQSVSHPESDAPSGRVGHEAQP